MITEDDQPADVEADPLCTAGPMEHHPPAEAPSVPVDAQAPKTNGPPQDRVPPDQEPPEPSPSPFVAYELIPPDFHPAVHPLIDRYKGLGSGRLGQIDVTPHRIALHPVTRPMWSQRSLTGFHHRRFLADQVAKKLQMRVIVPSRSEWSFPVVIAPRPDGSQGSAWTIAA